MHFEGDAGLWIERFGAPDHRGSPALFLDRDGVVVEEVDYLGRASDVRMIPGVARAIAAVNRLGLPVILVTNQAGIGRGYYDWSDFAAVQAAIARALAEDGAHLDLVLACAYHPAGLGALRLAHHPWRKPASGMLATAGTTLGVDLARSHIVGDKIIDLEAGANAGLEGGTLVATGHGSREIPASAGRRAAWTLSGVFAARTARSGVEAIAGWLADRGLAGHGPAPGLAD